MKATKRNAAEAVKFKYGSPVLYFNDEFKCPEVPRHAIVTGFNPSGGMCLHVFRHPFLDAGESVMWARDSVKLLKDGESPERTLKQWCRVGDFYPNMPDTDSIPVAEDDPEAGFGESE